MVNVERGGYRASVPARVGILAPSMTELMDYIYKEAVSMSRPTLTGKLRNGERFIGIVISTEHDLVRIHGQEFTRIIDLGIKAEYKQQILPHDR